MSAKRVLSSTATAPTLGSSSPNMKKMKVESNNSSGNIQTSVKSSSLPVKLVLDVPPFMAKLNKPLIEHQNENLSIELLSAKRRIDELNQTQSLVLKDRDFLVDCLSMVLRSWQELDSDLRLILTKGDQKSQSSQSGDVLTALENLFLPSIKFTVVAPSSNDEDQSDDEDEDDKGDISSKLGPIANEDKESNHAESVEKQKQAIRDHMHSRVAMSKKLAQLVATTITSSTDVLSTLSRVTDQRCTTARIEEQSEKLALARRKNSELEADLLLSRFKRDRAKSKMLRKQAEIQRSSSLSFSVPQSPATPALARNSSVPGGASADITTTPIAGRTADAARLTGTADTPVIANSNIPSNANELPSGDANAEDSNDNDTKSYQLEIERLKQEIQRAEKDFDARIAKHTSHARRLTEELIAHKASEQAAKAEVAHLKSVVNRHASGKGSGITDTNISRLQKQCDELTRDYEEERRKRRLQATQANEKLSLQADLYRKAMRDLEQGNVDKASTKERYQKKVRQLETETYALSQTLKSKDAKIAGLNARLQAAKVAEVELASTKNHIKRTKKLHEEQLKQVSIKQAARIDELEFRLKASPHDEIDPNTQLLEVQKELRETRAKFHDVSAADGLYAEIERMSGAFSGTKKEIDRLKRKLDEKSADCQRYAQAKSKAERLCVTLKAEKMAASTEKAAAESLQKHLNQKLRNLEQQLATFKPLLAQNEALTDQLKNATRENEAISGKLRAFEDEHSGELKAQTAQSESLKTAVTKQTERLENRTKEVEKLRRQYMEQRERLAHMKRTRRKLQGDELEKKHLYEMLECQVCQSEFKNVMLPCLHFFCRGCIDKQIKARHRKCPACNARFDADAIKTIHFNS